MIHQHCGKCGFNIDIYHVSYRGVLKALREHLITAKLFGCHECIIKIKNKINDLRNKK